MGPLFSLSLQEGLNGGMIPFTSPLVVQSLLVLPLAMKASV